MLLAMVAPARCSAGDVAFDGEPAVSVFGTQSLQKHTGSWWVDWQAWLKPLSGAMVAAPKAPGNRDYKPIEPAPGRYVKERAV